MLNSALGVPSMTRRSALKFASLASLAVGATAGTTFATSTAASAATPKWKGHVPGKIHLGWATPGGDMAKTERLTGAVGLRRSYYDWDGGVWEDKQIKIDHSVYRLPWISFAAPTTKGGWGAVNSGAYDADIRARARRYATYKSPVIVTFSHEPHTTLAKSLGTPDEFIAAWCRVHDIMNNETGLANVASVPIIGEWAFSKYNKAVDPEDFISAAVLNRCAFLGVDLYQNSHGDGYAERLGYVTSWLDSKGRSDLMVGLGETGCSNDFGSPGAATWWTNSWKWAAANTNRVGAISYWNSDYQNILGHMWLLWESDAKLAAYRASLASSVTVGSLRNTTWVNGGGGGTTKKPVTGGGGPVAPALPGGSPATGRRNVGAL